jgi:hypothetical protein
MKKSLLMLALAMLVSVCSQAFAQSPEMHAPPRVLAITREEIKPGMMPMHTRHSSMYVDIFNKLQTPNRRIAMIPVAGNQNEVMYISGCETFAELERILSETDKKMGSAGGSLRAQLDWLEKGEAELHASMRDSLALYRQDLSFNPGVNIPLMRYFAVTTIRIRPGHDAQFVDYVQKLVNVARQKAKVDNLHIAVFQVLSGAPGGTYLSFRPMRSLAEMDDQVGTRVRAAMSEDQKKDADKAYGDAVMSSEVNTYMFVPQMSYVDEGMAAADPGFWNRKPAMMMPSKPKPRKQTTKPVAPPPPTE